MLNSINDPQPSTMPNTRRQGCRSWRKGTPYPHFTPLHSLCQYCHSSPQLTHSLHRTLGTLPARSIRLHSLICKGINLPLPSRHQVTIRPRSSILRASAQITYQCRYPRAFFHHLIPGAEDKEYTDLDRRAWRDQTPISEVTLVRCRPET